MKPGLYSTSTNLIIIVPHFGDPHFLYNSGNSIELTKINLSFDDLGFGTPKCQKINKSIKLKNNNDSHIYKWRDDLFYFVKRGKGYDLSKNEPISITNHGISKPINIIIDDSIYFYKRNKVMKLFKEDSKICIVEVSLEEFFNIIKSLHSFLRDTNDLKIKPSEIILKN